MKALVTGASGFLGRSIVELLVARGYHVSGLCRRSDAALSALGVEVRHGDVRDAGAVREACRGVDVVFHTASIAGIWGPWRAFYETNVLGTQHVLEGCRRHEVARLVYTSSPSVTFDGGDQCGIDESVPYPTRWLCHYPRTKALAEQQVLASSGQRGPLTCALRPHLIWGPRDRHLVPRLVARARAGRLLRVGDGTNRIDITYVENAALAHLQAADALRPGASVCGRAYFVSQGNPVLCWSWIDELLGLFDLPRVQRSISLRAAWRIGAALEIVHKALRVPVEPRMTRFLAAQLGRSHWFDISAAQRDFGYQPRVSTAEGMQRVAASIADTDTDTAADTARAASRFGHDGGPPLS